MKSNKITAILLAFGGLFTLTAGIYFFARSASVPITIRTIFLLLLVVDAILYFVASWVVAKKIKRFFYAVVLLLSINIIALIFDDVGLVDLLAGFYNLILIILLAIYFKIENGKRK